MDEQKLVPKLRFPGFTDPWEQRKLGEVFDERNEKGEQGELLSVTIGAGVVRTEDLERAVNTSDDRYNYKVVKKGDLIYNTMRMWQGACGSSLYTGIVSPAYTVLVPLAGNSSKFFAHYFKRKDLLYLFKRYSQGLTSDTWNLKFNVLKEIKICVPLIEEQYKIADFLEAYDSNLTLHQRKLEHLKLKKKSLLQKLFPREGELYPELRFPGFTDPWEQRKLGEMGSTYSGMSGKTKEDFGHGEAVYIPYLNIFQNTLSNLSMTDKVEIDDTQNKVEYGDILFTTSSETPEEVGLSSVWLGNQENLYLNSFCFGYRLKEIIDLYFLGYALRSPYMRNQMKILAQGISRYNISKNKVMDLQINIPCIKEQKYIGEIFLRIDSLITLHQRKLEHLQLLKKALLQQLFV